MQIRAVFLGQLPPARGGVAISLSQMLHGISQAGHEICAIAPVTTTTMKDGDWFAARHPELRVVRYWLPEFYSKPYEPQAEETTELESAQITRIVGELVKSFRPNVLIAGRESYAFHARELARKTDLPWVLWLRGSPTVQILSSWLSEETATAYLETYRSANLVISVAEHIAQGLEQRYGMKDVCIIPNAVDLGAFRPGAPSPTLREELSIVEDHRLVMLPGILVSRKRPMDFVKAAKLVLEHDARVTFILAGLGDMYGDLQAFCADEGLQHNVRFLHWIPHERMPEVYNSVDLVVMTSEAEGISRVYVETLACGRPLLASDIAAAREIIDDGHNGLLYKQCDHRHLAQRIIQLLEDEALLGTIKSNARASVVERTLDKAVQRYIREIQSLLVSNAASPPT